VPAVQSDLSASLSGGSVHLSWTRTSDPRFQEYDVFRTLSPTRVESATRGPLGLLALALAATAVFGTRRSLRRRALLLAAASLPWTLASADPPSRGGGPRDCVLPGCTLLSTYTDPDQTEHVDPDVGPGDEYFYFLRVVNDCGNFADTDMVPISVPLPTATPAPTRTPTPIPPTPTQTRTPVPATPTSTLPPVPATPTPTPTPEVIQVTVLGTNWKNAERFVTDLRSGDLVSIGPASGLVTFNTSPPGVCADLDFTVDANGLDRGTYQLPANQACYTGPDGCLDPLTALNEGHAGLYLKHGTIKQFVGRNGRTFTASSNGPLSLGVNDCDATPNSGQFSISVTVNRRR
jgi:hypothetical protein